ncbi:hypothetical protein EMIT0P4_110090 [Pseudomonas sp. IT-P4]
MRTGSFEASGSDSQRLCRAGEIKLGLRLSR